MLFVGSFLEAKPLVVAHRGASGSAPENTIPAFRLAWAEGADAIEGDFHLTKDSKIVCIHDKDTLGISKTRLIVKNSSLDELKNIELTKQFSKGISNLEIPTFSEVVGTIPKDGKIYIEIKSDSKILPYLYEKIKESELRKEQVVVISFNSKVIYDLKNTAPSIKGIWLSKLRKDAYGRLEPSIERLLKILKLNNADGLSIYAHRDMPSEYVERIKKEGYEFHAWTVDSALHAKKLSEYGVDSITTNYPRRILKALGREPVAVDNSE